MAYLVVVANHVAGNVSQEPTAARVIQAFQQILTPAAGFTMIGGVPRITREIHADQRSPAAIERGVGSLSIGLGFLAAPFTMGLSLVGPIASQAASRAAAGAVNSVVTTTATAVVETNLTAADAERKVQQDFAQVLGNGWGRVVVTPFNPAVNGPFNDWYNGTIQRNSATTNTQSLAALAIAPRENPVGPTPAGSNVPGAGAVTDLITNAGAAGREAVNSAANTLRAGIATVTSATGDGIRQLSEAARRAIEEGNQAARSTLTTVALAVGGIAAVGIGVAYVVGKSSGRSTTKVAGDALSSAFSLTPIGRAARAAKNPSRALPGSTGEGGFYHIEVRPKGSFSRFRTQDVGEPGGVERVAGRTPAGHWHTQKWLISKRDAHVEGGHLVGDTPEARALLAELGSAPRLIGADRFVAHDRSNVPEYAKPTPAMRRAQTANIHKAQAAWREMHHNPSHSAYGREIENRIAGAKGASRNLPRGFTDAYSLVSHAYADDNISAAQRDQMYRALDTAKRAADAGRHRIAAATVETVGNRVAATYHGR